MTDIDIVDFQKRMAAFEEHMRDFDKMIIGFILDDFMRELEHCDNPDEIEATKDKAAEKIREYMSLGEKMSE